MNVTTLTRIFLSASLVTLCISIARAESPVPTNDTIQAWWKSKSDEAMDIEGDPIEVHLRNKEVAYLAPVAFYQRGRNDIRHTILVRPALEEVREVGEPVRSDIEVHDLNHDGVSEIVTVSLGSGQGSTIGEKSIVQFDEWTPVVLHQAHFEDNAQAYGLDDYRFFSRSVSWRFTNMDKDGNVGLVEDITIEQGRNNRNPITTKLRFKFVFKDNQFIRCVDYKRSLREERAMANTSFQGTRRQAARP